MITVGTSEFQNCIDSWSKTLVEGREIFGASREHFPNLWVYLYFQYIVIFNATLHGYGSFVVAVLIV